MQQESKSVASMVAVVLDHQDNVGAVSEHKSVVEEKKHEQKLTAQELEQLQQQCEMKLRLVYFNLKFVNCLLNIIQNTAAINPLVPNYLATISAWLDSATIDHEGVSVLLDIEQPKKILHNVNHVLTSILAQAYQYRSKLENNLKLYLCLDKFFSLRSLEKADNFLIFLKQGAKKLLDLNKAMNAVTQATYLTGAPTPEAKEDLELKLQALKQESKLASRTLVAEFKNSEATKQQLLEGFLLHYFDSCYAQAAKLQRHILLLKAWQKELIKHGLELQLSYRRRVRDLTYTLRMKELLFDFKLQFYRDFFKEINANKSLVPKMLRRKIFVLDDSGLVAPHVILEQLVAEDQQLKNDITTLETELQNYSWSQGIVSSLVRFWKKSYYYQLSESYFDEVEEATRNNRFRNFPLLNTKLTPRYKATFTTLGSAFQIKTDSLVVGWIGLGGSDYPSMWSNAIFAALMAQFDNFIFYMGNVLQCDEERVINSLPQLKWLVGLDMLLISGLMSTGGAGGLVGYLTLTYLVGSASKELVGYGLDVVRRRRTGAGQGAQPPSRLWELSVKFPLQHLAYILSNVYLAPKLYNCAHTFFVKFETARLLTDKDYCLKYASSCKEEALKALDLTTAGKEPTALEIHSAWLKAAKGTHPDISRLKTAEQSMQALNSAYDRLQDLRLDRPSP